MVYVPRHGSFTAVLASILVLATPAVAPSVTQAAPKAAKKVAVTFKADGGKIGSKPTLAKKLFKGKKVGKLPAAKRAGYAFKGWYTKRSGGKKVSKNTKIRAKTTLYARWKRVLSAKEKELLGDWSSAPTTPVDRSSKWIKFRSNGTFSRNMAIPPALSTDYQHFWLNEGLWRVQGEEIIATNILESVEWHANNAGRGYKNKPIADQRWTYLFDNKKLNGLFEGEGFTWLRINHYPSKGGYEEYGYDYVKPTQVE